MTFSLYCQQHPNLIKRLKSVYADPDAPSWSRVDKRTEVLIDAVGLQSFAKPAVYWAYLLDYKEKSFLTIPDIGFAPAFHWGLAAAIDYFRVKALFHGKPVAIPTVTVRLIIESLGKHCPRAIEKLSSDYEVEPDISREIDVRSTNADDMAMLARAWIGSRYLINEPFDSRPGKLGLMLDPGPISDLWDADSGTAKSMSVRDDFGRFYKWTNDPKYPISCRQGSNAFAPILAINTGFLLQFLVEMDTSLNLEVDSNSVIRHGVGMHSAC